MRTELQLTQIERDEIIAEKGILQLTHSKESESVELRHGIEIDQIRKDAIDSREKLEKEILILKDQNSKIIEDVGDLKVEVNYAITLTALPHPSLGTLDLTLTLTLIRNSIPI